MAFLESQYSNQVSAQRIEDSLAPGQVTGLQYTVEQGRVLLAWDAVTVNADGSELVDLAGYRVFRKATGGDAFALIATVGQGDLAHVDTTVKDGANFIYAVAAIDGAEVPNEGDKSADLAVKTIPSVPGSLTPSATEVAINLNWASVKDEADVKLNENLAGYNVYRSITDGSGYSKVGTVGADETTFSDATADLGTVYFYVVTAFDNSL